MSFGIFDDKAGYYYPVSVFSSFVLERRKAIGRCPCGYGTEWFLRRRKHTTMLPVCGYGCDRWRQALSAETVFSEDDDQCLEWL